MAISSVSSVGAATVELIVVLVAAAERFSKLDSKKVQHNYAGDEVSEALGKLYDVLPDSVQLQDATAGR